MESKLTSLYTRAGRRLLLLDYDGTLRDFEPSPEQAAPTSRIKQLLQRLAADGKNTVAIISGRDHQTLDDWLGKLPLYFVAEHGMAFRAPQQSWQFANALPTAWQAPVRRQMDRAVTQMPGSLMEVKSNSLAWHYRQASAVAANHALHALLDALAKIAQEHGLRILHGDKVVEVQPLGIDKGSSARRWFDMDGYDFVLAMGDDITDEDLFRALPAHAATVKVGNSETIAMYRLPDPQAVRDLLEQLATGNQ